MKEVSFLIVATGVCVISLLRYEIRKKKIRPAISAVLGFILTEFMLVLLASINLMEREEEFSVYNNVLVLVAIHIIVPFVVALDCYRVGLENKEL